MIASFFQNLNAFGVDHLLISGQATVLYGAATFSEDIDLWLDPIPENCARFLEVLRAVQARYYKLTPALTVEHLQRGHGFHFVLPEGGGDEVYLDVMGVPPRVGNFTGANASAQWKETDWGRLRVIGIRDLVELKKTQRLEDYPIIGRLALAYLAQPECPRKPPDFHWAIQNVFTLPELHELFAEWPQATGALPPDASRELAAFASQWNESHEVGEPVEQALSRLMQAEIAKLQDADRRYWRTIVSELKSLRASKALVPENALV